MTRRVDRLGDIGIGFAAGMIFYSAVAMVLRGCEKPGGSMTFQKPASGQRGELPVLGLGKPPSEHETDGPGGPLIENRTGRAADKRILSAPSARRLPRGADESQAQARLARLRVTAYCPCEKCCGKWADGITASGTRADHRLVAAPQEFPFGTVMTIPGYGTVKVEDRGGAIKGDRLDVLFPTHQEALEWGVQWLDVEIGQ